MLDTTPALLPCSLPPSLPFLSGPYLLPLAVGGEFLGGNEEAESEDGFELCREPLGLEVLKLRLPLPKRRHVQTQAEHLLSPALGCPAQSHQPGREVKLSDSPELISEPSAKEMPASLMTHACE